MATYNLGQVAIVSKGAWSSATSYVALNTVTHNGGSFMAIAPSSNKEPGVATGWQSYWVATSVGIKTITVTALSTSTAQISVTFTDGTTYTSGTINTAGVPDNSVTTAKIVDGNVTAAKLGNDILPANVGIKMGTTVPTTSDISNGQIYFMYS